ncbi:MAG TPA: hypothetical protein VFP69_05855 [Streptomyces sp.]|nr:hypothetical protein [Streptomyces sp.]
MPASILDEADRLLDTDVTRDTPRHATPVPGDHGAVPALCPASGRSGG